MAAKLMPHCIFTACAPTPPQPPHAAHGSPPSPRWGEGYQRRWLGHRHHLLRVELDPHGVTDLEDLRRRHRRAEAQPALADPDHIVPGGAEIGALDEAAAHDATACSGG